MVRIRLRSQPTSPEVQVIVWGCEENKVQGTTPRSAIAVSGRWSSGGSGARIQLPLNCQRRCARPPPTSRAATSSQVRYQGSGICSVTFGEIENRPFGRTVRVGGSSRAESAPPNNGFYAQVRPPHITNAQRQVPPSHLRPRVETRTRSWWTRMSRATRPHGRAAASCVSR